MQSISSDGRVIKWSFYKNKTSLETEEVIKLKYSDVLQQELQNNANNNTEVVSVSKQLILSVYPVGSYYETSDPDFNPNTAWGGTWVKDTQGRVMVAKGQENNSAKEFFLNRDVSVW